MKSFELFLIIYVFDILIAGTSKRLIDETISLLCDSFEIEIMKNLENFVGLLLNETDGRLDIDQQKYIEKCVQCFGLGTLQKLLWN